MSLRDSINQGMRAGVSGTGPDCMYCGPQFIADYRTHSGRPTTFEEALEWLRNNPDAEEQEGGVFLLWMPGKRPK